MSHTASEATLASVSNAPGRTVAGCLALAAFTIGLAVGWYAGNPAEVVIGRAIVSMFVCLFLGLFAGWLMESAVRHELSEHARAHPIPDSSVSVEDLIEQKRQGSTGPSA